MRCIADEVSPDPRLDKAPDLQGLGMARRDDHRLVEREVEIGEPAGIERVHGLFHGRHIPLQGLQQLVVLRDRGGPERDLLDDRADRDQDLGDLLLGDLDHDRAAVRVGHDEPFLLEDHDRLAHGTAADAVSGGEVTLDEAVAVYGDEHPRTEIIRENLAWAFEDASRPADAAEQWQILLSERESQFGAADEDTVEARMRLAFCCRRSGQLDEAIIHYEQAIEHVASQEQREELRLGLSASLNLSGRHGEAIQQLRLVLASRRRRKGKGHLDTLVVHHRLGRAHTQAGQANAAVETLREAYRTALNASGDPEVRRLTLRLRRDLAGAYSAAGRPREADTLLF